MCTEFTCAAKNHWRASPFPAVTCDASTATMFSVSVPWGQDLCTEVTRMMYEWAYVRMERGRI